MSLFKKHSVQTPPLDAPQPLPPIAPSVETQQRLAQSEKDQLSVYKDLALGKIVFDEMVFVYERNHLGQSINEAFKRKGY